MCIKSQISGKLQQVEIMVDDITEEIFMKERSLKLELEGRV